MRLLRFLPHTTGTIPMFPVILPNGFSLKLFMNPFLWKSWKAVCSTPLKPSSQPHWKSSVPAARLSIWVSRAPKRWTHKTAISSAVLMKSPAVVRVRPCAMHTCRMSVRKIIPCVPSTSILTFPAVPASPVMMRSSTGFLKLPPIPFLFAPAASSSTASNVTSGSGVATPIRVFLSTAI